MLKYRDAKHLRTGVIGFVLIILVIAVCLVLSAPWFYALSKIAWANLFYKYRGID